MIDKKTIKRYAEYAGFKGITLPIERDFLLDIIIYELYETSFSQYLVFKGGTALKKVFFNNKFNSYRFSKDELENFVNEINENKRKFYSNLI